MISSSCAWLSILSIKDKNDKYVIDADEVAQITGKHRESVYASRKKDCKLDKLAIFEKIKELVENGYISKDQGREAGGAFCQVNYTVYESPLAGFRDAEKEELLYNNNTNIIKEKINEEENFNLFWNQYSKAIGKKNTVKEWNKLTTEEISEVLTSLPMYLKDRPDKKYRKDPERYLKHKVFKDYLAEPKTKFKDYE